jgi:hypothetical protein
MRNCYIFSLAFLMIMSVHGFSQTGRDYCGEDRFLQPVFEEVSIERDFVYGRNTTLSGKEKILHLDIYAPKGDALSLRPLIVMAHGGAFVSGDREQVAELCLEFARRGYVVANMEYRLIDKLVTDSTGMFRGVVMAIHDMRAAVRYFREDADRGNRHKVDTTLIFAAGASAGAIMASHLGILDPGDKIPGFMEEIMDEYGGFEGNSSDNTGYSSAVHGVLNYSGALMRTEWMDADDAPVYSAHDEFDPTVPCDYNKSNIIPFPVFIYGSCAMKTVADRVGLHNQLYLVEGSDDHVGYFRQEESSREVVEESAAFLKSIFCQSTGIPGPESLSAALSVYPNPFVDEIHLRVDAPVLRVSILNLQGQLLDQVSRPAGNRLALGHLDRGLYLLRIETAGGTLTQKILKQ